MGIENKYTKIGRVRIEPPAPNNDKTKPIIKTPIRPSAINYYFEIIG
tara:strand:+ start:127 stop:267 length:141 start_codon:yes stop_codon:yes gene_type:complete